MRNAILLIFAMVVGILHPSLADEQPWSITGMNQNFNPYCRMVEFCRGMASAASCVGPGGDEAVYYVTKRTSARCVAFGSTGTFTVNLRTADKGHDASTSTAGVDILAPDMSQAFIDLTGQPVASTLAAMSGPYMWGEVKTCTGCSVNLTCAICDESP